MQGEFAILPPLLSNGLFIKFLQIPVARFSQEAILTMLDQYANVLIFIGLGGVFVVFNLFVGSLIRPQNPSPEKLSTYECGEEPVGGSWIQFNIRFYVIALDFIIFDVEIALLYPWAVVSREFGWYGFGAMSIFVLVLLLGLAYAWRKGALEWVRPKLGPGREAPRPAAVSGQVA